jgi:hypothetical protein
MGWKIAVAVLALSLLLNVLLPASESGPANAGRFVLDIWLAIFLLATCLAWIGKGRIRSLVLFAMASPLWAWAAYVTFAELNGAMPEGYSLGIKIGFPAVVMAAAALVTFAGFKQWPRRSREARRAA